MSIKSLTKKLKKSESPYYVAVVPINMCEEILIGLRKEDGIWTTPAGGANPGESPEDCAVRECFEEANLHIDKDRLELISVKTAPNGKPVHCYLYRTNQSNLHVKHDPDKEVDEWVWTQSHELPDAMKRKKNLNRFETIIEALLKYHGLKKSDKIPGGLADDKKPSDFDAKALAQGMKVEMEHTSDHKIATEIAMDHLTEDLEYYDKLKTIEKSIDIKRMNKGRETFASGGREALLEYIQGIRPKAPDTASRLYEKYFPKDGQQDTDNAFIPTPDLEKSMQSLTEKLNKAAKIVTRHGKKYYSSGKHAGKEVGTVRKKGVKPESSITSQREETRKQAHQETDQARAKRLTSKIMESVEPKKEVPTQGIKADLSATTLNLKESGRTVRAKGLAIGKPSTVPYEPVKTNTNMIGQVAFGKASKAKQADVNKTLQETDLIIDALDIKFKQPIDFTCQNLKGGDLNASFQSLKDQYQANDRIDLKSDSQSGRSLIHEVGHAVDYSLSEKGEVSQSFFGKMNISYQKDDPSSVSLKADYDRLNELLREAPFYKDSGTSHKTYLKIPSEVFARSFEVVAYSKALELEKSGKISKSFTDAFHPDFLKDKSNKTTDPDKAIKEVLAKDPKLAKEYKDIEAKNNKALVDFKASYANYQEAVKGQDTDNLRAAIKDAKSKKAAMLRSNKDYSHIRNKTMLSHAEALGKRADSESVRLEITSIMERILKTNDIKKSIEIDLSKGGPGSGQKGHHSSEAQILSLNEKLKTKKDKDRAQMATKMSEHLKTLTEGAVLENAKTTSGKPMFTNMEHATAHGYTVDDHNDAMNTHYEIAQKMSDKITQLESAGHELPKEAYKIRDIHNKKFKEHFRAGQRVSERAERVESAAQARKPEAQKVKKSITQMGHHESGDLDTGAFANAYSSAQKDPQLLEQLYGLMDGFEYGDFPRELTLDKGILSLVKVDDGQYTGYFRKEEDGLEDNAKIRIERITLPELVQLLLAKEYATPMLNEMAKDPEVVEKVEIPSIAPMTEMELSEGSLGAEEEVVPNMVPEIDRKLEMLKLISKLLG